MDNLLTYLIRVACLAMVALLCSSPASAQVLGRTVVIPYGSTAGEQPSSQSVAQVELALSDRRTPIISLHEARDRFVALSRAPGPVSPEDVAFVKRESAAALEHVAFGRAAEAQRTVRQLLNRAETNLESLQRDTDAARSVLDACLSLVQLALQQNDRRGAVEQATSCRHYVPDVLPHESLHPARVIGVLAEADDQIRRLRSGQMRVESAPATECSVFVNGRHLGLTPFTLERAAPGEARVQLKCNTDESRVHLVQLGDKPVSLHVDILLDQSVLTEPRLALRYARSADASSQVVAHAAELGKAVRADDVVLVGALHGRVELVRVHVADGRLVARALYTPGLETAEPERALEALIEGRIESGASVPAQEPTPVKQAVATSAGPPSSTPATETSKSTPNHSSARVWTGIALATLGGGLYAAGWGFDLRAHSLSDQFVQASSTGESSLQSDYDRARDLRWLGVGGAALATAAVPVLVRPRAGVPWWSWSLAGAGAALAGAGLWQLLGDGDCAQRDLRGACLQRQDSAARGALLISAAAPLFSVPLTHLFTRVAPGANLSLAVSTSQWMVALRIAR